MARPFVISAAAGINLTDGPRIRESEDPRDTVGVTAEGAGSKARGAASAKALSAVSRTENSVLTKPAFAIATWAINYTLEGNGGRTPIPLLFSFTFKGHIKACPGTGEDSLLGDARCDLLVQCTDVTTGTVGQRSATMQIIKPVKSLGAPGAPVDPIIVTLSDFEIKQVREDDGLCTKITITGKGDLEVNVKDEGSLLATLDASSGAGPGPRSLGESDFTSGLKLESVRLAKDFHSARGRDLRLKFASGSVMRVEPYAARSPGHSRRTRR